VENLNIDQVVKAMYFLLDISNYSEYVWTTPFASASVTISTSTISISNEIKIISFIIF